MSQAPAFQPGDDWSRLAMTASGIGTAIVDLERRWVQVNPAFERMFGYRAQDVVGRPAAELTHPEDAERAGRAFQTLLAGEAEHVDLAKRCLHRDGRTVWTQAHLAVVRDDAGAPRYLLVQVRDAGDERAEQAARAEALDASQRQLQMFADAVSHDLRAPLRSIESFSARLAEHLGGHADPSAHDYLGRIRAAASRMNGLLAALSDLSYATRAELHCAPVDLSLLADWAIAELQDAEPGRDARIDVQPGLVGYGDERLLKMLMSQLLGNAWKFSRECPEARIEVSGHHGDTGLELTVRDAGCGFDMRYAHKLFEPFQRLHGPGQGGGHGLGLAIAQRIVERHHGRLSGESADGRGASFHVHLPAAPAMADTPPAAAEDR